jgi:hypothetical protein
VEKPQKEKRYPFQRLVTMEFVTELDITLNDEHLGILHNMKSGWKMDEVRTKID